MMTTKKTAVAPEREFFGFFNGMRFASFTFSSETRGLFRRDMLVQCVTVYGMCRINTESINMTCMWLREFLAKMCRWADGGRPLHLGSQQHDSGKFKKWASVIKGPRSFKIVLPKTCRKWPFCEIHVTAAKLVTPVNNIPWPFNRAILNLLKSILLKESPANNSEKRFFLVQRYSSTLRKALKIRIWGIIPAGGPQL